jgi:hypothetical protein
MESYDPRESRYVFPVQYALEFLHIEQGDLKTAQVLKQGMKTGEIRDENFFLMVHQVTERDFQAVIGAFGQPIPLVHDLGVPVAKVPEGAEATFGYELTRLSEFATHRRYEEGRMLLTPEEAEDVLLMAEQILTWVRAQVNKKLSLP